MLTFTYTVNPVALKQQLSGWTVEEQMAGRCMVKTSPTARGQKYPKGNYITALH